MSPVGGGGSGLEIVLVIIAASFSQVGNISPSGGDVERTRAGVNSVLQMNFRSTVPGLPSNHGGARAPGDKSVPHSHCVAATVKVLGAFGSLYRESSMYTISFAVPSLHKNPRRWRYYYLHFTVKLRAGLHIDHPRQRQDPKPEFLLLQPPVPRGLFVMPAVEGPLDKNIHLNSRDQV